MSARPRSRRPGPGNRPLAFPYNRWHASQWTVDQATALLVCSAGRAADAGVPADRWLFPHVALHSSQAVTLTARRHLHAWPAMGVLGRAAEARLGRRLQRPAAGRAVLLLPRRGAGAAARARPPSGRDADVDRWYGLRRRAVQPLRPPVDGRHGGRLRADPSASGWSPRSPGCCPSPGWPCGRRRRPPPDGRTGGGPGRRGGRRHRGRAGRWPRPPTEPPGATVVSFTVTYGGPDGPSRCAPPWWPTWPMGSAPLPPAKMQPPPASPSREGLIGRDRPR